MAFTSIGYDGSVNERQWAELVPSVGSSTYGIKEADDLKVTAVPGQPLMVSVAAGTAWGHGVMDTEASNTTITCDAITSGTRWDLIALRRDWQPLAGGPTSVVKVTGTADRIIPARQASPGITDDQPLALVQWTAGQTQPTAIVDLRCWAGNGGMVAQDMLALTYLGTVGARVTIAGSLWSYELGANDSPAWVRTMERGKVGIFGVGAALAGSPAVGMEGVLIQAGSAVLQTEGQGYARITWPKPFPNGLLTVTFTGGDDNANGVPAFFNVAGKPEVFGTAAYGNKTEVVYAMQGYDAGSGVVGRIANRWHRVNWVAIGW